MATVDSTFAIPNIPERFSSFADAMKSTMKETINFKINCNSNLTKWQSKVGGIPYLPLESQYPVNSDGEKLLFLAQVNFSELPHIDDFPKEGIVEFFIDAEDSLLGLEDDGFKVLFFKNVIEDDCQLQNISGNDNITFATGPFEKNTSYSMDFSLEKQYISTTDYRFKNVLDFGDDWQLYDEYDLLFPSRGHRIGGYPFFTQTDPRCDSGSLKDYELLFQLDSDQDILWGDMGVGSFFIKPYDLNKLDFSNILYNWDCC